MNRRLLTPLAIATLAAIGIACGGGDSGSSTSTEGDTKTKTPKAVATAAVGQPLTLTEVLFGTKTVATVTVTNLKVGVKSGNQFVKPSKGQFITADVAVEVKEGKYSISSGQFKLVAADGTAYDSTTMLDSNDISGTDLTPGQKTSGQVVFDAAVGAEKGGKIALKSWLAEGDAGYWTLP